ncbi:MAG: aminotransferase class V-fold PLP-dependent enzyme [Bacteroidota bacterium]
MSIQTDPPRRLSPADLRKDILGIDLEVPLLGGGRTRYVFLDNAASTPALGRVWRRVSDFLPLYSGVHRGTGFKSLLATEVYDAAHDTVGRFVGADLSRNTVIFTKNTTECVNKLAHRLGLDQESLVVTTVMEHHSNDLPWRRHGRLIHTGVTPEGRVDPDQLRRVLRTHAGKVRLVAVSGASNITGICTPVHDIARWAHEAGALLFVDAAQLAPHRPIDMLPDDDPGHIDFLALSAHKMYAPFGTGALIGPKAFFREGAPDMVGGGVVEIVTLDEAVWNAPPHRDEAGSPNVVGGVALAAAAETLTAAGMENVARHETELLVYAYGRLRAMNRIVLYGPTDDPAGKVGTITFNVEGMHHALVAAVLGAEGGIGVRNGCFCAHPYVKHLLGVTPEEDRRLTAEVMGGNKSNMPGMVRASLGCYSTQEDLDALFGMLERVVAGDIRGTYRQDARTGAFIPEGFDYDFARFYPHLGGVRAEARDHSETS